MAKQKTPGNLRDFRIDGQTSSDVSPPVPGARQELKSRQSSVQEWGYKAQEDRSLQELWPEWTADQNTEVNLARPQSPVTSRSAAAPLRLPVAAPTHTRNALAAPRNAYLEKNAAPAFVEGEVTLKAEVTKAQPWAVELALDERRMESEGTVDFTSSYQKQELLKIRTREYTMALQESFRSHIEIFNDSRRSPSHAIHIYKVSKAEGDFMLFRNGVKLVVSGQRSGKVLFAFNQYLGQIFAPTQSPVVEIDASWGPFDQLFWSFKGERVQMLDVVRYFLTEFSRQSYR